MQILRLCIQFGVYQRKNTPIEIVGVSTPEIVGHTLTIPNPYMKKNMNTPSFTVIKGGNPKPTNYR